MFRVSQHPSSGVLKTVTAATGTGHTTCTATPLRGLIGTGLCELSEYCWICWIFIHIVNTSSPVICTRFVCPLSQVEDECGEIPTVLVQNKIDLLDQSVVDP